MRAEFLVPPDISRMYDVVGRKNATLTGHWRLVVFVRTLKYMLTLRSQNHVSVMHVNRKLTSAMHFKRNIFLSANRD